jgi:hypothetical protein
MKVNFTTLPQTNEPPPQASSTTSDAEVTVEHHLPERKVAEVRPCLGDLSAYTDWNS